MSVLAIAWGLLLTCVWAGPSLAQSPVDEIQAQPTESSTPIESTEAVPLEESIFFQEAGAPPGFENLDIPHTTVVDVVFGGQPLTPAAAIFTQSSVRLTNPRAVVNEMRGVLYPDRIVDALTGPLRSNSDLICASPGVPEGCGVLTPDEAGVIFDPDRFHLEVFVGRSMLALGRINEEERIPPPRDDWSGLATLGGSVSGTSNTEASYSFRADTLLAKGPTHLNFVGDIQTGGNFFVDRLSLNHDWNDWNFSGGLFRSSPFRVLGENEIVGLRARTSLQTRTRLYLDRAYGSGLRIFLLRRSLVQIFRAGQLLVSGVYDVGNQQLDTSELPGGAYEVEIRVRDPVSGERRERQFFAKTNDLPPLGQVHFNAEGGFLRERVDRSNPLQVSSAGVLRFSSAMRLSPHFGIDGDVALIDNTTLFTMGGLLLAPNLILRTGPIVTSDGAAGLEFFGSFERGAFLANTNLRGLWGRTRSRFLRIPSTDFIFTAGYTWKRLRFGLRGDVRDRGLAGDPRYSITPSLNISLFRRTRLRGDLRFEYTRADQGNVFFVKIDLVEWVRNFQFSQSVAGRYDDTRGDPQGIGEADLRAQWRSPPSVPADVQADFRVARRRGRTSISAIGDVRSYRGAINAFVDQSFHDDFGPETFYGSQFSVGVVGDREGIDALGDSAGASALLIEISGDYNGGVFDVFVNDSRRGRARVGQPLLLPLTPYAEYDVRLSSLRGQSVAYDSKARRVTLYPGSTARLRWDVQSIFVLIAAVVRPDGTPLAWGRVEGAVGEAGTDESGFLQADVVQGSRLRIVTQDAGEACEVVVPENPEKEDFVVLDEITCHESVSAQPAEEAPTPAASGTQGNRPQEQGARLDQPAPF